MADNMIFFNDNSLQRGRRRHVRFEIKKTVQFMELAPEEAGPFPGETRNMSDGGLMFVSTTFIPAGSVILLRVEQKTPRRVISKNLCRVLRVHKNALRQNLYEIACQTENKFRGLYSDEWQDLIAASRKLVSSLLAKEDKPAAPAESEPPRPRKVLAPMNQCPACGGTVEGPEKLCSECEARISRNFMADRGTVYGISPAAPAAPVAARADKAQAKADKTRGQKNKPASRMTQTLHRVTSNAISIIDRFGLKGDPSALPYLEKALRSNSPEIAAAAREAIDRIEEKQKTETYS